MTTADPDPSPISMRLGAVNFDAADPQSLAMFWAAATGGAIQGDVGDFVLVSPPAPGGPMLYFQRVSGARPPRNSVHLDFEAPPGGRDAEVERLLALGATRQYEVVGEIDYVDWTTLADPEGNLFCLGSPPS